MGVLNMSMLWMKERWILGTNWPGTCILSKRKSEGENSGAKMRIFVRVVLQGSCK